MAVIDVEDRADGVRVVTLNRPERRNALNEAMLEQLSRALEASPRAFLFRSSGSAFCAGFDVSQFSARLPDTLPDEGLLAVLRTLERHPSPTVALVQGAAIGGGCDLLLACDFSIASHEAVFWMPPAQLGIIYSEEGIARLTKRVGAPRAKRLLFTGCKLPAKEALLWNLVDEAHDTAEDAQSAANRLCEDLAASAPLAVQGMKQIFTLLEKNPLEASQQAALNQGRQRAFASEDAKEGREALTEKRKPAFSGR